MERTLKFVVVFLLPFLVALSACRTTSPGTVTFSRLMDKPESFNGQEITIEGFYFHAFESSIFTAALQPSKDTPEYLVPVEPFIWVEGGLPIDVFDKLTVENRPNSPPSRYGKVRITGKFQYGGRYGHVGGFSYQITISTTDPKVELLPWEPPE
jgi:hypothetical protein